MKELEVTVLLKKSPEDSKWFVSVPSIPGCHSESNNQAEAELLIKPVIEYFTENNPRLVSRLEHDQKSEYVVKKLRIGLPAHPPDRYPDS